MKRLVIDSLQEPVDVHSNITEERLYTVYLGNGTVLRFPSRRHALAAQAEASRQLTDMLFQANLLLVEAFQLYRMAWPYLDAGDAMGKHLRQAWDDMDRAAQANGPNRVVFRWRNVTGALASIRSAGMQLVQLYVQKTHAVPRHQAETLVLRCGQLLHSLAHYGADLDTAVNYRPRS